MQSRRGGSRRLRWVTVPLALGACGVGVAGGTSGAAGTPRPVRAVGENDGLRVAVTAAGSGTSATIHFTVSATDTHARGALGYHVSFGDGTGTSNAVPQFCRAGRGVPGHDLWHFAHHYARGVYHVTVTVRSNCTEVAATARMTVRPR
jgi:hypothetical protein